MYDATQVIGESAKNPGIDCCNLETVLFCCRWLTKHSSERFHIFDSWILCLCSSVTQTSKTARLLSRCTDTKELGLYAAYAGFWSYLAVVKRVWSSIYSGPYMPALSVENWVISLRSELLVLRVIRFPKRVLKSFKIPLHSCGNCQLVTASRS